MTSNYSEVVRLKPLEGMELQKEKRKEISRKISRVINENAKLF